MKLYELLVRGDYDKGITGWQASVFDGPDNIKPVFGSDMRELKKQLPELMSAANEVDLRQKITELQATISQLTTRLQQLAPNLAAILPALLEAGLTAWCDRAVTTYNESHREGADSLMPLVAQLYAAANNNDIAAVPPLFGEIMQRSMVAPTADEARAMQAVLDGVQFPPELIGFHPWIEQ